MFVSTALGYINACINGFCLCVYIINMDQSRDGIGPICTCSGPMPITNLLSSDHFRSQSMILIGLGSTFVSLIMTHIPLTNLFNAYDLQLNPLDEDKIRSQEVVNYCEVRFRVALQEMMRRSEHDQKWMFEILYREMVL